MIICGTSFDGRSPGIVVPSSEQKQSGRTQTDGSQGGARFGSDSASVAIKTALKINQRRNHRNSKKPDFFVELIVKVVQKKRRRFHW